MVACGVSFDDGDSWAHDTNVAICVQWIRMGPRVLLFNGDGHRDLLFLLLDV